MKFLCVLAFVAISTMQAAGDNSTGALPPNIRFSGEHYLEQQVTVLPKPVKRAAPLYPQEPRRAGRSGAARIAFIVNEKGLPEEIQVVEATEKAFGAAAVDAIKQWRFAPGERNGQPVRVVQVIKVPFTLNERR